MMRIYSNLPNIIHLTCEIASIIFWIEVNFYQIASAVNKKINSLVRLNETELGYLICNLPMIPSSFLTLGSKICRLSRVFCQRLGIFLGLRSTLTRVIFMVSIWIKLIFQDWLRRLTARLLADLYSIWVFLWVGTPGQVDLGIQ